MTMPTTTPSLGEIVYLASCAVQMKVAALTTPSDTPNQYSASFKVMGDSGINLDAVMGPAGPDGKISFALREQDNLSVNSVNDLPTLSNTAEDIGKYWLLDELDDHGHVLTTWCYIWWGTYYRQIMMGLVGHPGPVPEIHTLLNDVAPGSPAKVVTSGGVLRPTWEFLCPSPAGPPGPNGLLVGFPDVDEISSAPQSGYVLASTANTNSSGFPVWSPFNFEQYLPQPFSVPQSAFNSFIGVGDPGHGTQAAILKGFTLPAQNYPWTPVVWGHLSAGGLALGGDPMKIGAEVLLNDQYNGKLIGRGFGRTNGEVNIMPHYSTPTARSANLTPTNRQAVIPANQSATIYVNLYNDGKYGVYSFRPTMNISALQSLLNNLGNEIGGTVATVQGVVASLQNWVGTIPTQIQTQLDAIANQLRANPIVNASIDIVTQSLTNFNNYVSTLADKLGVTNILSEVSTALASWQTSISNDLQKALDNVANQFGFSGVGHTTTTISAAINTLQPSLQQLSDMLKGNWIPDVVQQLESFTGSVTTPVQSALDAVTNAINQGVGHSISDAKNYLNSFQSSLDSVASQLGLSGTGNDISQVVTGLVVWVEDSAHLPAPLQNAINGLQSFLGISGGSLLSILDGLLGLLGGLFSHYSTDAQLFVMVVPMLQEG